MRICVIGAVAALSLVSIQAFAQGKPVNNDQGITVLDAIAYGSLHSSAIPVDDAHGLPVRCISGCSGGGGGGGGAGDASTSNQFAQIAAANVLNTRMGDVTSPATGSLNNRVEQVRAAIVGLGSPLQNGGLIGNAAFAISGTLPAFAVTPTVNLGTLNGAATATGVAAVNTTLGSPFQVGGLIGNAFFGARLQDASGTAIGTASNPVITASSVTSTGAAGAAAPANVTQIGGRNPAGNLAALSPGSNGGLIPTVAVPFDVAPIAVTVGTATQIDIARATRMYIAVVAETSPTADVFICTNGQTNCSATVHQALIPAGAAKGSEYVFPFGATGAIYAFSTASVTLKPHGYAAN